jgi:hypothetical protein
MNLRRFEQLFHALCVTARQMKKAEICHPHVAVCQGLIESAIVHEACVGLPAVGISPQDVLDRPEALAGHHHRVS